MKIKIIIVLFLFYTAHNLYSQSEGVVSYEIPVRNSLKFNKFIINPAFSFVREQSPIISFYNKRQWTQFDNAPQTYLFSYSGRFLENEGVSLGLFQQNYGLLTTFGGVVNFAHNLKLEEDSNLTFGVNLGIYKNGFNSGKVITNYSDPALDLIPSNFLFNIEPGINYGTTFFDFGLSFKNILLYNFKSSEIVKDDPNKGVQVHVMYTGYVDSYGLFDRSKFSGILKSEFKKDKTVISGLGMLSLVKGIWAQAGYNTVYGMSGGLGLNITPTISMEYNYERGTGNLSNFGASHEIAFAYKLTNKNYNYEDDEEVGSIIPASGTRKQGVAKPVSQESHQKYLDYKAKKEAVIKAQTVGKNNELATVKSKTDTNADAKAKLAQQAKLKADADAALTANQARLKAEADAKAKLAQEAKLKSDADAALAANQARLKAEADAKTKLAQEAKLKSDADTTLAANQAQVARLKAAADAKAKLAQEAKLKADADAALAANQAQVARLKAESDAKAKLAQEAKLKADADAALLAKQAQEVRLKAEADAKAKLAQEAKLKSDADAALAANQAQVAKLKAEADAKAKLAQEAKLKSDADAALAANQAQEARLKAESDAKAKLAQEAKLKADADAALAANQAQVARLKAESDAKAKLAQEAKLKADADAALAANQAQEARLKAESDAKAKLAQEAKLKADADAALVVKQAQEARLKAESDAKAKLAQEAKLKADADATLVAKQAQEARLKAESDAKAKLAQEAKLKADADAALVAKQAQEARLKAESDAKSKLAQEAKLKAEADAKAKQLVATEKLANEVQLEPVPKDENAKSISNLTKTLTVSNKEQKDLLRKLNDKVADKQNDLNEMKEENDLSEQGIFKAPKAFKSVSAEKASLESLKSEIDAMNKEQKDKITVLDNLYKERINKGGNINDEANKYYLNSIDDLKEDFVKSIKSNNDLISTLEKIEVDTEIEKKRRIKKASFSNNQDRYLQDVEALKRIKENTVISATPLKVSDFDFGEKQSNVQVLKDIKNTESGFYIVLAVHEDVAKRDQFLTKVIASGESNINFFYDVKSGKYFIYKDKFSSMREAQMTVDNKSNKPYNTEMAVVKIE